MSLCDGASRQWALLALTFCFLLTEVTISRMCDSLITLVDSFHTLSVSLSLAMPLLLRVVSGKPCPGWLTFGWNRLPALWTLTSSLLLSSLCFSITLNALGRFVNTHPPHRPNLSMGVGVTAIVINLVVMAASSSQGSGMWKDLASDEFTSHMLQVEEAPEQEDQQHRQGETQISHIQKNPIAETRQLPETASDQDTGKAAGTTEHSSASPTAKGSTLTANGDRTGAATGCSFPISRAAGGEKSHADEIQVESQEAFVPALTAGDEHQRETLRGSSSLQAGNEMEKYLVLRNTCTEELGAIAASPHTALETNNDIEKGAFNSRIGTEEIVTGSQGCITYQSIQKAVKCMFCPSLVLINSLLYHFMDHECLHERTCPLFFYLDPLFCLVAVIFLLAGAFPKVKHAGFLLLQGVPRYVSLQRLDTALKSLPGVVDTHELHVWHLSRRHIVASVHLKCANLCTYLDLMCQMQAVFQHQGIHSFTVQPEFTPVSKMFCSLVCGSACSKHMCCSSGETTLPVESCSAEEAVQELVIANAYI
ncbi:proton-coupled zinc antiporter SLC30A1-like [Ambystoma mexicanum]|uniref:proton-coupled zinc antiporter SLC30A1-like n=1 Tax=Ambystoma mexicanum TaxID=8296 RepID=UPI0037E943D4